MTQNSKHKIPVIGITGGVGSGKSVVMDILEKDYHGAVILADLVGHDLMRPGQASYQRILEHFGQDILVDQDTDHNGDLAPEETDGAGVEQAAAREIDRKKLGAIVFADEAQLAILNDITHKAIRQEIIRRIELFRQEGKHPFIALEAALLIEEDYGDVLDQLWYIHVDKEQRIRRLMRDRGYDEEKCRQIISRQLPDEVFFDHADVVIDNNGAIEDIAAQVDRALKNI